MKHIIRLNLILGVWLLVSPFAFGYDPASTAAMGNDVVVGLAIIGCTCCVVTGVAGQCCAVDAASCGAPGCWWCPSRRGRSPFGHDVIIGAWYS